MSDDDDVKTMYKDTAADRRGRRRGPGGSAAHAAHGHRAHRRIPKQQSRAPGAPRPRRRTASEDDSEDQD